MFPQKTMYICVHAAPRQINGNCRQGKDGDVSKGGRVGAGEKKKITNFIQHKCGISSCCLSPRAWCTKRGLLSPTTFPENCGLNAEVCASCLISVQCEFQIASPL